MKKTDAYRKTLSGLERWEPFLLEAGGLPGPRANLELADAVAELGRASQFDRWLEENPPERAPANSPEEFLAFCGALGWGRLAAEGRPEALPRLRALAGDPRWRVREAVARGLQIWGRRDMPALLGEMEFWAAGGWFEKRAAVAALAEPGLLAEPDHAVLVLGLLDRLMADLASESERHTPEFRAFRQAMAYAWSVAVAAHPQAGRAFLEKWSLSRDTDVRWVLKQNLQKKRLERLDLPWRERLLEELQR